MPTYIAIDDDPFAGAALSTEPRYSPVDYDPFERAAARTRRSVRPPRGRKEGLATALPEKVVMDALSLPRRAFGAAQQYSETGEYNPAPIMETALTAMTGGMPFAQAGALGSAGGKGIRAYHGSPHDFDKFDMSRIGTGEGAQAYGHGLYFAENEGVAKSYKGAGYQGFMLDGKIVHPTMTGGPQELAAAALSRFPDKKQAIDWIGNHFPTMGTEAKSIIRGTGSFGENPGRMYEVNINARPEQFLDWDKPLSGQSEQVRSVYQKMGGGADPKVAEAKVRQIETEMADLATDRDPVTNVMRNERQWHMLARERDAAWQQWNGAQSGQQFYRSIPGRDAASRSLLDAGIPGIKYLDQWSRTAGEGSRNYVVFDDRIITILRKYGLAGLTVLPPATAAAIKQQLVPVENDPFAVAAP